MSELPPPQVLPDFVDRRTSFVTLGILAILLGGLCCLFIPTMAFGQLAMARKTGIAPNWAAAAMPMGIYLLAAIVLITLGIGSIRTRRWARALTVCLAWMAIVIGSFTLVFTLWITANLKLPQPDGETAAMHASALTMVRIVLVVTMAVFFLLIPLLFIWLYSRPDAKATCEARNPQPSWTDRCPLPVLAACLFISFSACATLLASGYSGLFPIATIVLQGLPARLLWIANFLFGIYATRGFYRLNQLAWGLYLIVFVLQLASTGYTFWRGNLMDLYLHSAANRYRPGAITPPQPFPFDLHRVVAFTTAFGLAWIGYVIYLRRYFPKRASELA